MPPLLKQLEKFKSDFSAKSIDEIRKIATDGGANYSAEAMLAAKELLLEKDPKTDQLEMMLHLQRKNESIMGEMERRVGCLYQFLIFQVIVAAAGVILGLLRMGEQ